MIDARHEVFGNDDVARSIRLDGLERLAALDHAVAIEVGDDPGVDASDAIREGHVHGPRLSELEAEDVGVPGPDELAEVDRRVRDDFEVMREGHRRPRIGKLHEYARAPVGEQDEQILDIHGAAGVEVGRAARWAGRVAVAPGRQQVEQVGYADDAIAVRVTGAVAGGRAGPGGGGEDEHRH